MAKRISMWLTFHFLWGQCPICGKRLGRIDGRHVREAIDKCECGHAGPFIVNSFVRCRKCRKLYTKRGYKYMMEHGECPMCHVKYPHNKTYPEYFINPMQCLLHVLSRGRLYKRFVVWDRIQEPPTVYEKGSKRYGKCKKLWNALTRVQEAEGE